MNHTAPPGRVFDGESREFRDERTGARVVQLTQHRSINHNLFFLTSSFTPDQSGVVFASHRTGDCQFYMAQFPEGPVIQLTDQPNVHGYSAVIAPDGVGLYYCADGGVWLVVFAQRLRANLFQSAGASLGEVSLSADGQYLVTAMKQEGARTNTPVSQLVVTRTDGGGSEVIFTSHRTIIHPQFHPDDPNVILYAQDPAPRMWMINRDGSDNRCLYEHDNDVFLVHETFLGGGDELIVVHWNRALCRFNLLTSELAPMATLGAWHISSNRSGSKVLCDTNYPDTGIRLVDVATGDHQPVCYPRSSNQGSQWKTNCYALAEDFARAAQNSAAGSSQRDSGMDPYGRALSWMEMKVDTVYGPQWTHPHPSFSPDERWVCYTSDVSGCPQVYAAEVPAVDSGG